MASLQELLLPQVVTKVISRIREGQGRVSRMLGMTQGGKNTTEIHGRYANFRIFDHTRVPAMGRAPNTGPATIPNNEIGQVPVQMARFHEKAILDYESLGNLSLLSGPNAQVDKMGADYIAKQEAYLGERLNNSIEVMNAGMLRGQFYLKMVGENFIPYLAVPGSGNYITVDYRIPSGNKSQLNMLGAGNIVGTSWANPNAPILQQLLGIKAAFAQLHGRPLKHVFVNSTTWYYVITNTEVRNVGGVVAQPFDSYTQVPEKDSDGEETNAYIAVLRADPTIQWHIIDDVLAIDGTDPSYANGTATLTKVIADNVAVFLPPLDSMKMWAEMVWGSEPVVERDGEMPTERMGLYAWSRPVCQPSAIELITLLNGLPVLYVPKSIAYGTVIF